MVEQSFISTYDTTMHLASTSHGLDFCTRVYPPTGRTRYRWVPGGGESASISLQWRPFLRGTALRSPWLLLSNHSTQTKLIEKWKGTGRFALRCKANDYPIQIAAGREASPTGSPLTRAFGGPRRQELGAAPISTLRIWPGDFSKSPRTKPNTFTALHYK